jgi:hypothetical protein
VGPRSGLDDVEKRKFLTLPGLNSDPLVVQPVASRYTDCAILAVKYTNERIELLSLLLLSVRECVCLVSPTNAYFVTGI